jgi:hypothetical protein
MQLIFLTGSWCCHGNYYTSTTSTSYCHIFWGCDYRWVMDWMNGFIDLVCTTRNYTLQITDTQTCVNSLLQSQLAIFWQWLLQKENLQLPTLRSSCHSHLCRTPVNWQLNLVDARLVAIWHQPPTPTLHTLTFNWQLHSLTHQPATSSHFTQYF